jgi:protein-S-isoprenylcysteine O-methyltransferase Ste14
MYAAWGVWGCAWVIGAVLARRHGSAVTRRDSGDTMSRAAGLVAIVAVLSPRSWWHPLEIDAPAARALGATVLVVCTVGAVLSRIALGPMWSSGVVTKQNHRLRTHGPYRLTRHPIYTTILGMVIGTALCEGLGRWLVICPVVIVALSGKARAEERLLLEEFDGDYAQYQRDVPQLIPSLRRLSRQSWPSAGACRWKQPRSSPPSISFRASSGNGSPHRPSNTRSRSLHPSYSRSSRSLTSNAQRVTGSLCPSSVAGWD